MSGGKSLPTPGGGDQLTALLRGRHVQTGDVGQSTQAGREPAVPAPASPAAAEAVPARKSADMDRRSWYMPKASADALAELVEELHWETRRPKHEILAALVDVALAGREKVAKKLSR